MSRFSVQLQQTFPSREGVPNPGYHIDAAASSRHAVAGIEFTKGGPVIVDSDEIGPERWAKIQSSPFLTITAL